MWVNIKVKSRVKLETLAYTPKKLFRLGDGFFMCTGSTDDKNEALCIDLVGELGICYISVDEDVIEIGGTLELVDL